MAKKGILQWDFRDVSSGIKKIREFLLGRKYVFHNRFHPLISPRSIPPPDVPRGPEYKYSDQWYGKRDVLGSVKPPVVAPIAEGVRKPAKKSTLCAPKKETLSFICPPTPGMPWWFDGHCYYELVPAGKCGTSNPCKPPPAKQCPPTNCPKKETPPCPPPPPPCDPCQKPVGQPEPPCNPCKQPKTCN